MANEHPDTHSPAVSAGKEPHTICVFCGSSPGQGAVYMDAARELGTLIGRAGFRFLFGGGRLGLMGAAAVAAHDAGSRVVGIMPEFLKHLEPPLKEDMEEVLIVPDLFNRKDRMIAMSDAFAVLPGGLGTMDELFEVITSAQLLVHAKPIVVMNTNGYFDPMLSMIDQAVAQGFAQPHVVKLYSVVRTPEETMAFLTARLAQQQPVA